MMRWVLLLAIAARIFTNFTSCSAHGKCGTHDTSSGKLRTLRYMLDTMPDTPAPDKLETYRKAHANNSDVKIVFHVITDWDSRPGARAYQDEPAFTEKSYFLPQVRVRER